MRRRAIVARLGSAELTRSRSTREDAPRARPRASASSRSRQAVNADEEDQCRRLLPTCWSTSAAKSSSTKVGHPLRLAHVRLTGRRGRRTLSHHQPARHHHPTGTGMDITSTGIGPAVQDPLRDRRPFDSYRIDGPGRGARSQRRLQLDARLGQARRKDAAGLEGDHHRPRDRRRRSSTLLNRRRRADTLRSTFASTRRRSAGWSRRPRRCTSPSSSHTSSRYPLRGSIGKSLDVPTGPR